MIQRERAHAVELGGVRQQAVFVAVHEADDRIHLVPMIKNAFLRAIVIFRNELQDGRGFSVYRTAVQNAALRVDGFHGRPGQSLLFAEQSAAGLEFSCISYDKIAGGETRHVLIHIEACGEVDRNGQQNNGQRQREDCHRGFSPAAAQIGPGHGERGDFPRPAPFVRERLRTAVGITDGFHRRNPGGHPAGPAAGEEHGEQGEQGRRRENERIDRCHGNHVV